MPTTSSRSRLSGREDKVGSAAEVMWSDGIEEAASRRTTLVLPLLRFTWTIPVCGGVGSFELCAWDPHLISNGIPGRAARPPAGAAACACAMKAQWTDEYASHLPSGDWWLYRDGGIEDGVAADSSRTIRVLPLWTFT